MQGYVLIISQGDALTAKNFGICICMYDFIYFFLALTKEFHVEIFFEHSTILWRVHVGNPTIYGTPELP